MRNGSIVFLLLLAVYAKSQNSLPLIPYPQEVEQKNGSFLLKKTIKVSADFTKGTREPALLILREELQKQYGIVITWAKQGTPADIQFSTKALPASAKPVYQLTIDKTGIFIKSNSAEAAFHAIQTLLQLLPAENKATINIPYVAIKDEPRFDYRGMHLDVGRHYFPVSYIKRYIDYLAYHKLNKFHWHLTEDQGWRVEIEKYPRLTSVGAWRNGTIIGRYPGTGNTHERYGGFYTKAQIKEVVQYAQDRYIEVVPEIELPGHGSAAIAAYPELSCFPDEPTINFFPKDCIWSGDSTGKQVQQTWGVFDDVFCAGKENTFVFLQHVLDEILPLFPSKLIHIGGDECPKANWKRCPHCQKRMKENNLKDEHELQSYFIQRIEKYLNSKGREIIGWDEILEGGLAPNAAVMSWRGEEGGIIAAQQKHNAVMTPGGWMYFDHSQSQQEDSVTFGGYTSVEKTYSYEPVPAILSADEAKYIIGAQANLWTEYITNPAKIEYMLFPRISALSEVVWAAKGKRNWEDFEKRLQTQFRRYEKWGVNYSKAYFDLHTSIIPASDNNGLLWKVESKQQTPISLNFNNTDSSWNYTSPQLIDKSLTAHAYFSVNGKKIAVTQQFQFSKATGKKITTDVMPSTSYPGDGAFTLVNGVRNEKGLSRSKEFIGFEGNDVIIRIDLGEAQPVNKVIVHTLESQGSWIYSPAKVEVQLSTDNTNFTTIGTSDTFIKTQATGNGILQINSNGTNGRYLILKVSNFGIIPVGKPGAGHKAWLFLDEISVD